MSLLPVAEARARVLAALRPTEAEMVHLAAAWGRVAAQPLVARVTQPPADVSAMDGFALRAADAAVGARLRVIGTAPAGHPWSGTVQPGEALRLFTGSLMPSGADAVLLQEDASAAEGSITVGAAVAPGQHVRRAGQDFATGDVVLAAGQMLSVRAIGLAAAANLPWVAVHRRPQVAILATGDEIALPGEPIPPGGIVSSNAHALAALVRAGGGAPLVLPIAPDAPNAIAAAAGVPADLLVTTGGASVGAYDFVQQGLGQRGLTVDFWKIAMRPGKPLMFGRLGTTPVLGLPGNPVAALVCAVLFLRPALARLAGLPDAALPAERATLGAALPANDRRADFLRASLAPGLDGTLIATAFARQDSAMLRQFAAADALILRPPHAAAAAAGAAVEIVRLAALGL